MILALVGEHPPLRRCVVLRLDHRRRWVRSAAVEWWAALPCFQRVRVAPASRVRLEPDYPRQRFRPRAIGIRNPRSRARMVDRSDGSTQGDDRRQRAVRHRVSFVRPYLVADVLLCRPGHHCPGIESGWFHADLDDGDAVVFTTSFHRFGTHPGWHGHGGTARARRGPSHSTARLAMDGDVFGTPDRLYHDSSLTADATSARRLWATPRWRIGSTGGERDASASGTEFLGCRSAAHPCVLVSFPRPRQCASDRRYSARPPDSPYGRRSGVVTDARRAGCGLARLWW